MANCKPSQSSALAVHCCDLRLLCLCQVSVLEEISRGEVLLAAARRCLKLMQDFINTLTALADPAAAAAAGGAAAGGGAAAAAALPKPQEVGFEMVCALLNNSVDCYNQSLEFTEHVQVGSGFGWRCMCMCMCTCCILLVPDLFQSSRCCRR